METSILFVYLLPHPSHVGFANSIDAEYWHYHHYFNYGRFPKIFKSFINGLLLPGYDVYFCEGGAPLAPAFIKKLVSRKGIIIELIADETFMMIKKTPHEMKGTFIWYVNAVHRIEAEYINGAIAVSKLAKETAEPFLSIPIRVSHPYIEDSMYRRLGHISPDVTGHNIISVGYGKAAKGMDILVKAFETVKKEIPDVDLYVIGRGHPLEWNNIKGVHVLGYVEDLVPYFKQASLYVQSSRADTFPVATLESLWAGLPTIVSENTGTKEVVEKLGNEFVRKATVQDIAQGILYYFGLSSPMKQELSQEAKEISKKFNSREMCEMFKREFTLLLREIKG